MKQGRIVETEVKQRSNVIQEFSRFAHQYDKYNVIQAKAAKTLVEGLSSKVYKNIIDLGCGSGAVFKNFKIHNISVENFVVIDSSQTMLDIHPTSCTICKICSSFNEKNFLSTLPKMNFDLVISSSSLQWSQDIDFTINIISDISDNFSAAIFTSNTFKTLHATAGVKSPIYDRVTLQKAIEKYYKKVSFSVQEYQLSFSTTREMFKYIKQSGVSSGEKKLSYREIKKLMDAYPLNYLEFEVLFVKAQKI